MLLAAVLSGTWSCFGSCLKEVKCFFDGCWCRHQLTEQMLQDILMPDVMHNMNLDLNIFRFPSQTEGLRLLFLL